MAGSDRRVTLPDISQSASVTGSHERVTRVRLSFHHSGTALGRLEHGPSPAFSRDDFACMTNPSTVKRSEE